MKTIKYFVLCLLLTFSGAAQGQISVSVNIGKTPAWGPRGSDNVRYYYLPDVDAYYDVHTAMFIYFLGNTWIRRSSLPSRYRNYDLYHGRKVMMSNYHGNSPYYNHNEFKAKYGHKNQNYKHQKGHENKRNNKKNR